MKRNIKNVAILTMYLFLVLTCTKVYATTGTITEDTVRMREEASTSSDIVVLVPKSAEVEITGTEGEWYKVKYTDGNTTYTGYIRQDLVESENDSTENKETTDTSTDDDTSSNDSENNKETSIEIRILPLITSCVTGSIKSSADIAVTEIIGNWSYIESKNQKGWVMTSALEQATEVQEDETEEQKNEDEETEDEETETEEQETEEAEKEEQKSEDETETSSEDTETTELYVNVTTVNLREKASSSSTILKQLSINTKVTLVEQVDETWSKVTVSGTTGYIASEYLSETKTETTSRGSEETRKSTNSSTSSDDDVSETSENESSEAEEDSSSSSNSTNSTSNANNTNSTSSATGSDVVAYAKTFLGCKYVYGGTSPSGFDCSGFTQYVYNHFGYSISRTSSAQRSNGIAVSKSNLKAGDLVCFSGHVGIYIGSNQFIHAENSSTGVTISSLSESYYAGTYITARRIIY